MNKIHFPIPFRTLRFAFFVLAAAVLASCSEDDNGYSLGSGGQTGTVTPSMQITSRMETPRVLTDGTTQTIAHYTTTTTGRKVLNYSVEYNTSMSHSRWVAFRFDGDTRTRYVSRSEEPFMDDPLLAQQYHIGNRGFGAGYDRGHLCASADRLFSLEANEQTFYMTNMSPQMSSFNQGYWVTLEGLVQNKGRDALFSDTLYVVKGGTIRANEVKSYVNRSNGKKVAVPKYYYMALLKVKNGVYSSIAFWLEHKDYGYTYNKKAPLREMKNHTVSVNRLEQLTGIDFFPNLPDNIEEQVEDQCIPSNWGL